MTTPEELAFQKSTVALNYIRHGINFFSDKAFAENLINESNKSRSTEFGDGERTKFLLTALLDRIKTRPETFGILVNILKETSGMDFIGEELQKNLEKVRAELTAQGISHHAHTASLPVLAVSRNSGRVLSDLCVPSVPSFTPFTKQQEHESLALSATPSLSLEALEMTKLHVSTGSGNVTPAAETTLNHSAIEMGQQYYISTNTNPSPPPTTYARSNSQCSSDGDSDYATPSQSLSNSAAEKLFTNISRKELCKECLSQKTELLFSQAENRRLKAKLKVQDEVILDQAAAISKEEITQLKDTCARAIRFVQELEEKNSTLEENNSVLAQMVEAKERERQEVWRCYEYSTNLLLRMNNSAANRTYPEANMQSKTDGRHFRSQKVTEMLNKCSQLMLAPGMPTKGRLSEN